MLKKHDICGLYLNKVLNIGREAGDGVNGDDEWQEDRRDDEGNNETPPWETRVGGIDSRHRHGEATSKHCDVPPERHLLVDLHLVKVGIVAFTGLSSGIRFVL